MRPLVKKNLHFHRNSPNEDEVNRLDNTTAGGRGQIKVNPCTLTLNFIIASFPIVLINLAGQSTATFGWVRFQYPAVAGGRAKTRSNLCSSSLAKKVT